MLVGVTALSAGSAWAVGGTISSLSAINRSVIIHWNGHAWAAVHGSFPIGSVLIGVTAASARSAFAVGAIIVRQPTSPLVMNWNGTSWKVVPS
jgi:hypothetical protein